MAKNYWSVSIVDFSEDSQIVLPRVKTFDSELRALDYAFACRLNGESYIGDYEEWGDRMISVYSQAGTEVIRIASFAKNGAASWGK